MNNWYSKKLHKQANALSKSLGIPSDSFWFKQIQKFEKLLKDKGDWMRILSAKKSKGPEAAMAKLRETINGYQLDTENNPPDVESPSKIKHLKRTSTGGDWYFFDNSGIEDIDDDDDDYSSWLYANQDYLEEGYLDHFKDVGDVEHHFEEHWSRLMENLDDQMEKYLSMYKRKEESSGQEKMPFYENSAILRLNRRYNKIKKDEEERLSEAIKDANKAYSIDDLIYVYEEYMGEENSEELANSIRQDFEHYTENTWDNDEEYREEQKEEKYKEQMEDYFKLTCGAKWCISQPGDYLEDYLIRDGYSFLVLRRDKDARIAIRFDDEGIAEVQGIANEFDNINDLDFLDLMECPMFDAEDIISNLKDGINDVDDDARSEAFLEKLLELDNEVSESKFIQESIAKNIDKISQYLTQGLDFEEYFPVIIQQLTEKPGPTDGAGFKLIKEKIFQILRKEFKEELEITNNTWVTKIIDMMNSGSYDIDLLREFFQPYRDELLIPFFENAAGGDNKYKMWVEKEALSYLYNIFGQGALEWARRYGFEKSDNERMSREDTWRYISNNYFLVYGAEDFKDNEDAVHYVANTILTDAREPNAITVLNKLYNFLDLVMPSMKKVYGAEIAYKIVSLSIIWAEQVYPNDPTNQRHEVLSGLLINSNNNMSSAYLNPELVSLIHNDERIRHLKEMRKRLDYNVEPDPHSSMLYPERNMPSLDRNNEEEMLQAYSGRWYK